MLAMIVETFTIWNVLWRLLIICAGREDLLVVT